MLTLVPFCRDERQEIAEERLAARMLDSFIEQLSAENLLCAVGQADLTAALRKCSTLQERPDTSTWAPAKGELTVAQ